MPIAHHVRAWSISAAFLILGGCNPVKWAVEQLGPCPRINREYFDRYGPHDTEVFQSFDIETQYTVYMCGMRTRHPPAVGVADKLARGGAPTANYLIERLRATKDELAIRYIIMVFARMSEQGTYQLHDHRENLAIVEAKVKEIRTGITRRGAERSLRVMRDRHSRRAPVPAGAPNE